jgi:very-short-patch-repair endonuclease
MMTFKNAHDSFIHYHLSRRTGERRGRLERGHGHAEKMFLSKIWWMLRGNLDDLHPEYEIIDWRGKSYFADFIWLPGFIKLIIEIKGFNSHVRDMDRQKYCNELNRETFLHAMGYQVISFPYDDVEKHPELCISLLRMVLSRYHPRQTPIARAQLAEKEIIRLAIQLVQPIRPKDVEQHFEVNHRTAVMMLNKLCSKGWLTPAYSGSALRAVRYELARDILDYFN